MTDQPETLKLKKLADLERVEFGPPAFYHPLVADGDTPVRTGIQTPVPGYIAQLHWHPYEEILFLSSKVEWRLGLRAGKTTRFVSARATVSHCRQMCRTVSVLSGVRRCGCSAFIRVRIAR